MDYNKPRVNKSYRFYKKLPITINREGYDRLKLNAFKLYTKEEQLNKIEASWKRKCVNLWHYMKNIDKKIQVEIANIHKTYGDKVNRRYISECLTHVTEDGSRQLP